MSSKKILYIEEQGDGNPDIAFLQVEKNFNLPAPIPLSRKTIQDDDLIYVIGYPAKDSRNDANAVREIFKNIFDVKRLQPGRILQATAKENGQEIPFEFRHDCSTLGGNSGSVVVDLESGEAIGLHYSGETKKSNLAIKAEVLLDRLSKLKIQIPVFIEEEDPKKVIPEDALRDRAGYDKQFLGEDFTVEFPVLNDLNLGVIVNPNETGMERYNLKYTHFSVVMNKARKFACYTACNIDGKSLRRIKRSGDNWRVDERIAVMINGKKEYYQYDNALYKNNDLDRGHLTRRLDPVWGDYDIATQADSDTFFYTNSCPQHKDF